MSSRRFAGLLPLEVDVYRPADPAQGFTTKGLAQAEGLARARARHVVSVSACLRSAGLAPRRAETSPPGSIALETPVAGGGRALLYIYETPARAARELPAIERFLVASGGRALRRGQSVIGYTGTPPDSVTGPIEACG